MTSKPPDFQAEYTQQALARELGAEFELVARHLGQAQTGSNPLSSYWWLRNRTRDFDVIHAWDFSSARLACAARLGVIFSPSEGLNAGQLSWLKWMARHRDLRIVCPSEAHREAFVRCGFPHPQVHNALLPVQISTITARDENLRQSLGLSQDDRVLLAPGESARSAGHHYALWAASILHVLDPRWRLLVWGRGTHVNALQSLAQKFEQPRVLCVAEKKLGRTIPFENLVPAADLTLITPSGLAPPLPIQMCVAAGLPIVASESPVINEFLRDQENASVVPRLSPRLLAQRVVALSENQDAERKLSENARKSFVATDTRFVEQFRSFYRGAAQRTSR